MAAIQLGNVVPGAKLLGDNEKGVNETFIGFVDVPVGRVRAYIKVLGGRQLVNELLATAIGRTLNLPIPEGFLVRARPADLPDSKLLAAYGNEALLFASREVTSPDLKRRLTSEGVDALGALLTAWSSWWKAMTFDEWIANADRHPGNILFGGPNDIWLIDHSHSFTGPTWQVAHLNHSGMWRNQIADNRVPTLTLPGRIETRRLIATYVHDVSLVDCALALTESMAAGFLDAKEVAALTSFLQQRVSYLFDVLSTRLGIPNLGAVAS